MLVPCSLGLQWAGFTRTPLVCACVCVVRVVSVWFVCGVWCVCVWCMCVVCVWCMCVCVWCVCVWCMCVCGVYVRAQFATYTKGRQHMTASLKGSHGNLWVVLYRERVSEWAQPRGRGEEERGRLTWAGWPLAGPAGSQQFWGEGLFDLHLRGWEGGCPVKPAQLPKQIIPHSMNKVSADTVHVQFQVRHVGKSLPSSL